MNKSVLSAINFLVGGVCLGSGLVYFLADNWTSAFISIPVGFALAASAIISASRLETKA